MFLAIFMRWPSVTQGGCPHGRRTSLLCNVCACKAAHTYDISHVLKAATCSSSSAPAPIQQVRGETRLGVQVSGHHKAPSTVEERPSEVKKSSQFQTLPIASKAKAETT